MLDGDYVGARQMLHPQFQSMLTAERLGQEWQLALDQIGDPGPVTVSCRSQPGGVAALITFTGSKSPLTLLAAFTPSGQIAGLRFIASDEALPWLRRREVGAGQGFAIGVRLTSSCRCISRARGSSVQVGSKDRWRVQRLAEAEYGGNHGCEQRVG